MGHELAFIGANPAALLWDGDRASAFVSVWQVDWSSEGPGGAVVLCRAGELRVLCAPPLVGRWLFDTFVTHFSELNHFEKLPARPAVEQAPVKIEVDLVSGLTASAGDVTVRISGILDRPRSVVPGAPRMEDRNPVSSSAWLAVAETWARL